MTDTSTQDANRLLQALFGLSVDAVELESRPYLLDYTFEGAYLTREDHLGPGDGEELVSLWDQRVFARILELYGVRLAHSNVRIKDLAYMCLGTPALATA